MNSMHPVVTLGSYYWNQELLPRDEFAGRMRAARELMQSNGWAGLLVFGDCAEPGMLGCSGVPPEPGPQTTAPAWSCGYQRNETPRLARQ